MRDIHQIIDAQLMIPQMIHIFRKERLIEPKRADNFRLDPKLLPNLPDHGVLSRFPHCNSAAGQVKIGGALISHCQYPAIGNHNRADPVIKFAAARLI